MKAWRRLSIATRLPLVLGALLLLVLGSMTLAAYLEVRRSAIETTSTRLGTVANLLAENLAGSAATRINNMHRSAQLPAFSRFLRSRDTTDLRPILEASRSAPNRQRQPTETVEIWDANGETLWQQGRALTPLDPHVARRITALIRDTSGAAIGPLQRVGDSLFHVVVARIGNPEGSVGYLAERRRVTVNPPNLELIADLIGSSARLVIGNAEGDVWTDLATVISGPPLDVRGRTDLLEYTRANAEPVFAHAALIASTPWVILIEFPRSVVLAPSLLILRRASALSIALIVFGVAAGWLVSRRLTRPLRDVTAAAEAIAAGNFSMRVRSLRLDEAGRLASSFNVMAQQIEEGRRELELRVQERTAALEAANRELEAFSYSVSHDLRAPLRAMGGFANTLIEDYATHLPSDAQRRLEVIARNSRHMGQLIDDLLAFSRIGRQSLGLKTVDMNALANAVIGEARRADGERDVEFIVKPLPAAHGEPVLLRQVLDNLVNNAIKFTSSRRPARIEIGACSVDAAVTYYVKDNGVGFDMQYADKLFGVFQRLHRPDEFEGTGVGLAIVHRIVQRHGGRVWAESAPDQGAVFYFTLPVKSA
jgi:signal transduction histidine kinase